MQMAGGSVVIILCCPPLLQMSYVYVFVCLLYVNQSYPTVYAEDVKEMQGELAKVVRFGETVKPKELEETKKLWHRTFGQSYEKAGGEVIMELGRVVTSKPLVYWEVSFSDVNSKYKSMTSRFILEVG